MTERLYYHDAYLLDFQAQVQTCSPDGLRLILDRTAFYPTSGGQPHDLGTLGDHCVVDVIDEGDEIVHLLDSPWPSSTTSARGLIDVPRRLDHMRQHTAQHLLSAVMAEDFGLATVSFHLGAAASTVDVEPAAVSPATLLQIERRVNERLRENLSINVSYESAADAQGLRKESGRQGMLRIVSIASLDRSACGGTHLRHTGEIGMILLGGTEKVRQALRMEFVAGDRVLPRIRQSMQAEAELRARLADTDKSRKKLTIELAEASGQLRFAAAQPDAQGRVLWREEFPELDDALRAGVAAFVANPGAVAVLTGRSGAAVLFAAHPSLGIDCGKCLKPLLDAAGGRGGGSPRMAQGGLPEAAMLSALVDQLLA